MFSFFRRMLIEKEGNESIGSFCMLMLLLTYSICMLYAQVSGKTIVIDAWSISLLAVAIYGCKKIPAMLRKDDAKPKP
jgi:hypothetical protein